MSLRVGAPGIREHFPKTMLRSGFNPLLVGRDSFRRAHSLHCEALEVQTGQERRWLSTVSDSICLPQPPLSTGLLYAVILLLRIPRPEGWISIGFSRSYNWEKVKPAFLTFPLLFYIFRYCAGLPPVQTKAALTFHPPLQFKTASHLQKFLLAF